MTTILPDHVVAIAQDMFTAMVDGEPGRLVDRGPDALDLVEPVHAWVDIDGGLPLRAVVATGRSTAERFTRALLTLEPRDPVGRDEVHDALGELANVIGGNVKGLLPDAGRLTLPVVTADGPPVTGTLLWRRSLHWH